MYIDRIEEDGMQHHYAVCPDCDNLFALTSEVISSELDVFPSAVGAGQLEDK